MQIFLAVAAGGALGALLRQGTNEAVTRAIGAGFPWGIMLVNVAGCFLMGAAAGWFAAHDGLSPALRAFITAGLLGGFTTFSAFSLDAVMLAQKGALAAAAFYVFGSVIAAIAALCAGLMLARAVAA